MTTDELRRLLTAAGKSQRQLARDLDIGDREVRHWCAGTRPIGRLEEYAIRYLLSLVTPLK